MCILIDVHFVAFEFCFLVVITIFIQVVGSGLIEVDVQHANLVPLTHPFVTCML
jgi:hypothetical protein